MPPFLADASSAIRDFLELGGPMLNAIALTILMMWIRVFERLLFFRTELQRLFAREHSAWQARQERRSWFAQAIREASISRARLAAEQSLPFIRTLVALCPLLGLMGTVSGMIEVFDALAISGTGNARSMAAGVSRATIPTMAGMVGAVLGLLAVALLARIAKQQVAQFDEKLVLEHS
jgi:biopolymer transport protein ExbB